MQPSTLLSSMQWCVCFAVKRARNWKQIQSVFTKLLVKKVCPARVIFLQGNGMKGTMLYFAPKSPTSSKISDRIAWCQSPSLCRVAPCKSLPFSAVTKSGTSAVPNWKANWFWGKETNGNNFPQDSKLTSLYMDRCTEDLSGRVGRQTPELGVVHVRSVIFWLKWQNTQCVVGQDSQEPWNSAQ